MKRVEEPHYTIVESEKNIEIRDYDPIIVAEVEVSGERKEAIQEGFKALAEYIFGNNEAKKRLNMTKPVLQEQQMHVWKVRFVMEKKYTLTTIPKPNREDITLIGIQAKRFATIRFSGTTDDKNIHNHLKILQSYISSKKIKSMGGAIFAFYNPPWTLPFLRRNEVLIEIEKNTLL